MLTQMRALSQNFFGRAILGAVLVLLIGSFAIWGIGDRFNGYDANQIARIGSDTITVTQYRNAFQNELQRLQQQQKRAITGEEAKRLGIDRQVLSRLLTDALLDQQAIKLGMAVGDEEIVRLIERDPNFVNPIDQRFDKRRFNEILRENGYTEARYATAQRRLILRQEVSDAIVGGLRLPTILTDAVHRFQAEVRDTDFFVLPPSAAGTVNEPTDAEAKSYYDAHSSAYVAPEYRKLEVLTIVPVDLVKPDAVSQDDIQKRYDAQKAARFEQPERRALEQLVFAGEPTASAAKAKLEGGETFDKLTADEKKSMADVSLGTLARSDLADKAVADAAFALPEGGTSSPVKSQFGTVLVHVSKIVPGKTQPLMEVQAQLKDELAIVRAKQQIQKDAEQIEDARAAGKSLAEAAAAPGLKTRTIEAIDQQGRDRSGKPVEGLIAGPQLLKAAFASEPASDTEVIRTPDGGDEWYAVAKIDPGHQLAFQEVKTKVEAAWRSDETARKLAAEGDTIVKAIDGGETLAAAAAAARQPVMQARDVGRGGAPNLPSEEASAFFEYAVGKAGSIKTPGGRLVFKVDAARVPPIDPKDPAFNKLTDQVKNGFEDDVIQQYLGKVQAELKVTFNQRALATALGNDPGS